jgi:alkanesulfonate monooxygenase SsuD/methylene tetrahydromethanopterin reductase-like flavin-dependent oxidoreductase (luciferase family)
MADIGIMIEGQEDLSWARFFRVAQAVEDLGFESLFRSDHLVSLVGQTHRETLPLWPSLTALALRTDRIRFGPLVSPMTFRHPALQAKLAASVSQLSGGRLDVGIGAGWNEPEHRMFGIPYPPYKVRLELLDEGAEVIKALWTGQPVSLDLNHYQLKAAESYPLPLPKLPPLIMGGKGERALRLAAKHATEWNCSDVGVSIFREKTRLLDQACQAIGRDPTTLRRSVMIAFVIGRDDAEIEKRIEARRAMFGFLPQSLADWRGKGFLGGTPQELVEQIEEFIQAGASRFMLAHYEFDDMESLELLAHQVMTHFRAPRKARIEPATINPSADRLAY